MYGQIWSIFPSLWLPLWPISVIVLYFTQAIIPSYLVPLCVYQYYCYVAHTIILYNTTVICVSLRTYVECLRKRLRICVHGHWCTNVWILWVSGRTSNSPHAAHRSASSLSLCQPKESHDSAPCPHWRWTTIIQLLVRVVHLGALMGLDLTDLDLAYMGHLVANEQSAILSALGLMNYHHDHASDDQLDWEDNCVSYDKEHG